ncbi:MAG: heme exporter protein CcmD [Acidimicrobiales bacterium]|nr:heme exporter protein CcmD [Acidimicrobiales bacterium]MCB1013686.1 heme exporter protein CcmD [Acidimicrobiales bacterium]MCB9373078.1 heme exporter protein CcmD [Microthrixaceae bacterium]
MSHAGYVAVSYGLVLGSTVAYAAWVLVKGRRLSRQVPPEDRRWL